MPRTIIPNKALILVCDGAKALFFENAGDAQALNLKPLVIEVEPHKPTRELGSDRPTRVYDSMDGSRSGTDETDWHEQAEADFLVGVARSLDQLVAERRPLVSCAGPLARRRGRRQRSRSARTWSITR